ncbi:MAG: hypothetical protein V1845_00065 [bacterium]
MGFETPEEKEKTILLPEENTLSLNIKDSENPVESGEFTSGLLENQEKPAAIVKKLEYFLKAQFGKIEVNGQENLDLIPRDRRVIFASTHLSNFDVPISIYSVGQHFRLLIGDASTHSKFSENPTGYIGNRLAGKENFVPIKHKKDEKGVERGRFNPEDLENLKTAFEEKKALMMSVYYSGEEKNNLPDKGGYGAVYLAEIADALIVPVAVDIKSKEKTEMQKNVVKAILSFPDVQVNIGKPIELPKIEGIEGLKEIWEKRKTDKLSKEETEEFHSLSQQLREQSDLVMKKLAELLPKEKRGKWADAED